MFPDSTIVTQQHPEYTPEQHQIWRTLCERQMRVLENRACHQFNERVQRIGLEMSHIPRLDDINERIAPLSGWKTQPVTADIETAAFFKCLRHSVFPITVTLRSKTSLDAIDEHDIFHDVFGHMPLLSNPEYAQLLRTFGDVYAAAQTDQDFLELSRLYWFTIECGLVNQNGQVRLLGASLLSSFGQAQTCFSSRVTHRPFQLSEVIATPFRRDLHQDLLFVGESIEQLNEAARVLMYQIKERNAIRWPGWRETALRQPSLPTRTFSECAAFAGG